jgi:hypothetical protein
VEVDPHGESLVEERGQVLDERGGLERRDEHRDESLLFRQHNCRLAYGDGRRSHARPTSSLG